MEYQPVVSLPPEQRDSKEWPLVYRPLGRCVYCGSTHQLSTEHIVPRGLGGNIIFPRASCEKCRKITHAFETICMRQNFLYFRVHTGLHQHPNERPTHLPVRIRGKGSRLVLPSAIRTIWAYRGYYALEFSPVLRWECHTLLEDFKLPTQRTFIRCSRSMTSQNISKSIILSISSPLPKCSQKSKIAHCLVCAWLHDQGKLCGTVVFTPYLPPFIRGLNDNLGHCCPVKM
jgi:hypothetical protein